MERNSNAAPCFPFFINLQDKPCFVAGGGTVALRKIKVLLRFGAKITVAAPQIKEEILALSGINGIAVYEQEFESSMLEGMFLVIAATNNREVNHAVSTAARRMGLWVNTADAPEECTFFFPAVSVKGRVVAGISSGGENPPLTKKIRQETDILLERIIGGEISEWEK